MSEWQPIETAPKNGRSIVLFWPFATQDGPVTSGKWYEADDDYEGHWYSWDVNGGATPPTHWMPRPAPPQAQG